MSMPQVDLYCYAVARSLCPICLSKEKGMHVVVRRQAIESQCPSIASQLSDDSFLSLPCSARGTDYAAIAVTKAGLSDPSTTFAMGTK